MPKETNNNIYEMKYSERFKKEKKYFKNECKTFQTIFLQYQGRIYL